MHRIAIMERGIDGTSVYLIRVSYLPNCGLDRESRFEGEDDVFDFCLLFNIFLYFFEFCCSTNL
jgi:hypothetical protein